MAQARRQRPVALPEPTLARPWLALSFAVLVAAGVCALAVVVGRMPPFDRLVTDPLFFKRCLAAHVNFALVAWFYSFVAALAFLVPSARPPGPLARHAHHAGAAGALLMLVGAALPGAQPVLANYVPTIDHPAFQLGQLLFGAGMLAAVLDPRLLPGAARHAAPGPLPPATQDGLRAAAVALALAALTLAVSALRATPGLALEVRVELLVWGAGHVLQLVSTLAMVALWLLLLERALGRPPVSRGAAAGLFAALLAPWLLAPALAAAGTSSSAYRAGFTDLMRFAILPAVGVFLALCVRALAQARREGRLDRRTLADPRLVAFFVSAALTVLGLGLGLAIRGSTTMVPAHYHASVGAVTVAFMAATYALLGAFGLSLPGPRWRRALAWQPVLYGAGMGLLAAGFALAGSRGMGRKLYGAEQAARTLAESAGLAVMGVGGFVAVAGGVLFLVVVGAALGRGAHARFSSGLAASPRR
jgi:hypothetical protein